MDYKNINPNEYYNKIVFNAIKSVYIFTVPMWHRLNEGQETAPLFKIVPEANRSLQLRYIYLLPKFRTEIDSSTINLIDDSLQLPRVLGFSVMELIGHSNRDCILVDEREAIVADYLPDGGGSYLHITNSDIIKSIYRYFDDVWSIKSNDTLQREILYENILDFLTVDDWANKITIPSHKWDNIIAHLANNPRLLYSLSPREFEELIAELFYREGYDVKLTSRTKDGGKDILLTFNNIVGEQLYLVECKKYSPQNRVGVRLVRELYGTLSQSNATAGIIVTTSSFTRSALRFREPIKWRMDFKDYHNLATWLSDLKKSKF